jgi:hypothetical protein
MAAMNEAKQALADCPAYHRVPLHFRVTPGVNIAATASSPNPAGTEGMNASIHAPERQQQEESPLNSQQAAIDLETAPVEVMIAPEGLAEPAPPKKGPGRPKAQGLERKTPSRQ